MFTFIGIIIGGTIIIGVITNAELRHLRCMKAEIEVIKDQDTNT
jgi:hypothetical protein